MQEPVGNGLTNMQERAKQMKGNLTVESNSGSGTVITLTF
jgi:signal transduction histidine kinase